MYGKYFVGKNIEANRLLAGCPKALAALNFMEYPNLRYFAVVRKYFNSNLDYLLDDLEINLEESDDIFYNLLKGKLTKIFLETDLKETENNEPDPGEIKFMLKLFSVIAELEADDRTKDIYTWSEERED